MPPFLSPKSLTHGLKERVESLTVQGDRLYVGTGLGNLHIYALDDAAKYEDGEEPLSLVETKKALTRRSIDQLGFIKDINSLVVLSEMVVTLFPLPSFSPPTPLTKAKAAFSFISHSSIQHVPTNTAGKDANSGMLKAAPIPTLVTRLVVGCRRKVVIYTWIDGEAQEAKEAPLPHSARTMAFMNSDTLCFSYSPTEYAVFSIPALLATDIATTPGSNPSLAGMSAFSGITGYMSLGLGAKHKPLTVPIGENEAFIVKENEGVVVGVDAKITRPSTIAWHGAVEDIASVKPYIFAILPPGPDPSQRADVTSVSGTQVPLIATTMIQIYSAISLAPVQTLPFPFEAVSSSSASPPPNAIVRLLTSQSGKAPIYFITTPVDKTLATSEGSTIWQLSMRPWAEQVDELVQAGRYNDALMLLDTIETTLLPDKEKRRVLVRALNAVAQFRDAKFKEALATFRELDINPAKVVALYPEEVSGRLGVTPDGWVPLFGGPPPPPVEVTSSSASVHSGIGKDKAESTPEEGEPPQHERGATDIFDALAPSRSGTLRGKLKTGLGALIPSGGKDDDTASITSKKKRKVPDVLHRSVEALVAFLSDHRPKVAGALASVNITPANQSHQNTLLSAVPVADLYALPDAPLSALTPEQLLRFAQIVDTALFKSYLVINQGMLGPLCRLPNWCEVSEVEEELRAREKFAELIYLYNGKKMHPKALGLLRQLSEKETDIRDKLDPSISYLQKLGPEHLQHVFDGSRWVFEQDRDIAFEIFKSEEVELPRPAVADFLETIDPQVCIRYLEYLIEEREEDLPEFHDRLAELYLSTTLAARKKGNEALRNELFAKLLNFIDTTDHYHIDRLYGLLSSEDLYEARAILLGRMGRHDQALELYVYRLHDYVKAEEYCRRIYQPNSETSHVFLTLLRLYLRPTIKTSRDLLQPALDLVSRQSPRLDVVEALHLFPPLVTTQDIRAFLFEALRAPTFDTQVVRQISKARNDQIARKLMVAQSKRVKVTDSRICPQCHKRIGGNSVIAVHVPRGEVTHYQCREAFSKKLLEQRR
ncbi:hypothetical protein HGRIS_003995 [Hohenbuehelia grisea]|uniref:CNH domain-containing protein n=1 Tax=Hohenbuehelia grisea TaxID=104357 RepID=A0ABR3JI31_9AGAR